jgi:hypothetical protein
VTALFGRFRPWQFHDSGGAPIQIRTKAWQRIVEETDLAPIDLS